MMWQHKSRMYWTCLDIPGVVMDVTQTNDGLWLFKAADSTTNIVLEECICGHPLDAIKISDKFKETCDVIKEEARSESEAQERQTSGAV